MKKTLIFALIFISNYGFSQDKIENNDYEKIIELTLESAEEGNYEEAVEYLNRINKNDSTHCSSLITKSFYLLKLDKNEEAIKVIDGVLENNCKNEKLFYYLNKAVALSNLEKHTEANDLYDKAIVEFPKNKKLWYSKGITLEKLDRKKEAVEAYKMAIIISPNYRLPHLQLGNLCYKQGKITQALMCFNMYLLLEPDADELFDVLNSLNSMVASKNENIPDDDFEISIDDESFEDIDLIINNRISLNKKYKTGSKIDIALVRQSHVLIDLLKDYEGNGGFWDKKYVPFYRWIGENDHFNNFAYTISYSIENEKYKELVDKNTKNIISFIELYIPKWQDILSKNNPVTETSEKGLFYYYGSYLDGVGEFKNGNTVGYWEIFNEKGQISSKGDFNESGDKTGDWIWYNELGGDNEIANYKEGKLDGDYRSFHENKSKYVVSKYVDDEIEGEYIYYNERGALMQKKYFKKGVLDGPYESYFSVGEEILEFSTPYKNGEIHGVLKEYFANNKLFSELNYIDGKANGFEKKYYNDGVLSSEIEYKDNLINGSYTTYFHNGNIKEKGQSVEGKYQGAWKAYFYNGTISEEYEYSDHKMNGEYKSYDTDGKLHFEYLYKKGEVIAYKFYNKEGGVIIDKRKKGGKFLYTGLSPLGVQVSEGEYDISGGKIGDWKFYTKNGVLSAEGNYVENNIEGEYKDYYDDGILETITHYKNNLLEGYYLDYYKNGQINSQGWFKDDVRNGVFRNYYIDGTISSIYYYQNGKFHGEQEEYTTNGKLSLISTYEHGKKIIETYYNPDGTPLEAVDLRTSDKTGTFSFNHHYSKTVQTELDYLYGVFHGDYTGINYYGGKYIKGKYVNGSRSGEWTYYYEDGSVDETRNYLAGKKHGEFKEYHENGQLKKVSYYEFGDKTGTEISYFENGSLNIKTEIFAGNEHGRKEFYSRLGELQLIRFYNHGRLISYSYIGKDGKEVSKIDLPNETGKIVSYYKNGNVAREMECKNGDFIGLYKTHYSSGELEYEANYVNNLRDGKVIYYYPDGKTRTEIDYLQGYYHGDLNDYYENGTIKKEAQYLSDTKNGEVNYYNENGKLIKKEMYFDDSIYSSKTY